MGLIKLLFGMVQLDLLLAIALTPVVEVVVTLWSMTLSLVQLDLLKGIGCWLLNVSMNEVEIELDLGLFHFTPLDGCC